MVSALPLALLGGVAAVGLFVSYRGYRELRKVYHILTNDPVPVRDLPTRDGPVETEGTARPTDEHGTVHSPFTDSDCLAFEYETKEYRSSGQGGHWKTLDEGGERVPFLVADDTGLVRVDPAGAELHFEEHEIEVRGGEEPPPRIAAYIAATEDVDPQDKSLDLVVTELNYGNSQKFVERRLDVGEGVYVYGAVGRAPGGEWGSRLVDAEVRADPDVATFVISDSSERGTAWRIGKRAVAWTVVGLLLVAIPVALALAALL